MFLIIIIIRVSHKFFPHHAVNDSNCYVYINMQANLLAVYGIGFSRPRALSKYVSLVIKSLLKFFLHRSI